MQTNIITYFLEQVQKRPNAIAIQTQHGFSATYKEVDEISAKIAQILANHGVKVDDRVILCIRNREIMLIHFLATLRLNACYVPLDPDNPTERIKEYCYDITSTKSENMKIFCIADESNLHKFSMDEIKCLSVEQVMKSCEQVKVTEIKVPKEVKGCGAACILFTSGSTGKPKGVQISHKGIKGLVIHPGFIELDHTHCFSQIANVMFDASMFEIYGAFLNGGRLVIIDKKIFLDSDEFSKQIKKFGIDVVVITAAMLNVLIKSKPDIFYDLWLVLFGGEKANASVIQIASKSCNKPKNLINGYGPTEGTTMATAFNIPANYTATDIPIGKPINGAECFVVNEKMEKVKPGEIGEMCIAGNGIAIGYLDSEKTKEKFCYIDGKRVYRTGDLVYLAPDGNYMFVDRMDDQIKIRGIRIEPNEIACKLREHPDIVDAFVMLAGSDHNKHLVAYCVSKNEKLDSSELYNFMTKRVAQSMNAMVPRGYAFVKRLPLTLNGKVDKKLLQKIPLKYSHSTTSTKAHTKEEELLLKICRNILNDIPITLTSNFFEVGIDSLMALAILSHLKTMGYKTSIYDIFANPSIKELAKHIKPISVTNIPKTTQNKAPLLSNQLGIWLHQQQEPDVPFYNETFSITIKGKANVDILEKSLRYIINYHESFRIVFVNEETIQQKVTDIIPEIQVWDLSDKKDALEICKKRVLDEAKKPFDLLGKPLFKFYIAKISEEMTKLFCLAHHIAFDGISALSIFLPDLYHVYSALESNKTPTLPLIKTRYIDYVLWKNEQTVAKETVDFWKKELKGTSLPILPVDKKVTTTPSRATGSMTEIFIEHKIQKAATQFSKSYNVTSFTIHLAVYALALHKYSQQADILIASGQSGHTMEEIKHTMGYFLENFFLRIRVASDLTVLEWLKTVQETIMQSINHKDINFSDLLNMVQKQHAGKNIPLVVFVMEPPIPNTVPSTWDFSQCEIHNGTYKFDLLMELDERDIGTIGRLEYNKMLFSTKRIEEFISVYKNLLALICENPSMNIADIISKAPSVNSVLAHQSFGPKQNGIPKINSLPRKPQNGNHISKPKMDKSKIDAILELCKSLTLNPEFETTSDFLDCGGNSVSVILLADALRKNFQMKVHVADIYKYRTIENLIQVAHSPQDKQVDWKKECELDKSILQMKPTTSLKSKIEHVFLTGATGFVGPYLLREILDTYESCVVHCLIRPRSKNDSTNEDLKNHLMKKCKTMQVDIAWDRVEIVKGNLDSEKFGLDKDLWNKLANQIDIIFHNGALVDFRDYAAIKATNVGGTMEIIRLAFDQKLKPVHYVSTMAAVQDDFRKTVKESIDLNSISVDKIVNGYAQSKWVSESLLQNAKALGLPVMVYRPAMIGPHSISGACNFSDWFIRLVRAIIDFGYYPKFSCRLDLTCVDSVAKMIVGISAAQENKLDTFHPVGLAFTESTFTFMDFIQAVKDFGYDLKELSFEEWLEKLHSVCPSTHTFYPILKTSNTENSFLRALNESIMDDRKIDTENVKKILGKLDNHAICLNTKVTHNMLRFLIKEGCINKP